MRTFYYKTNNFELDTKVTPDSIKVNFQRNLKTKLYSHLVNYELLLMDEVFGNE